MSREKIRRARFSLVPPSCPSINLRRCSSRFLTHARCPLPLALSSPFQSLNRDVRELLSRTIAPTDPTNGHWSIAKDERVLDTRTSFTRLIRQYDIPPPMLIQHTRFQRVNMT